MAANVLVPSSAHNTLVSRGPYWIAAQLKETASSLLTYQRCSAEAGSKNGKVLVCLSARFNEHCRHAAGLLIAQSALRSKAR